MVPKGLEERRGEQEIKGIEILCTTTFLKSVSIQEPWRPGNTCGRADFNAKLPFKTGFKKSDKVKIIELR